MAQLFAVALASSLPLPAFGHSVKGDVGDEWLVSLIGMAGFALLWGAFLRGGWPRPHRRRRSWFFPGALLIGMFAMWGPLDSWATASASAHMVQHMLFIGLMAPLLVLSRALPQITRGLGGTPARTVSLFFRFVNRPLAMGYLHGLTIWLWHLPYFYLLALRDPWLHLIEHISFIATAVLFWWAVLNSASRHIGLALCSLLLTLMHTGILGAILTFAQRPLYGDQYALEDQQLAGLIMWVFGSFPYFTAALWVTWTAYRRLQGSEPGDRVADD
ncbi:cytochrome c oxidase assembly protein [Marinobacter lipolyticus]|uniref:cytochrome c oxidase assembly protein n=1 Tax=Marinobacter lipolyticus TaxID=209639 RepID=UPI001BCC2327|nr:cytochrome c oxidase assembly protein [Marinobacter lipolyticus]